MKVEILRQAMRQGPWVNIPNALTLSRYPLAIMVYVAVSVDWPNLAVLALIWGLGCWLTDFGNGRLARFMRVDDPKGLGGVLDPLADHFSNTLILVSLTLAGVIPWWFLPFAYTGDYGFSNPIRMVLLSKGEDFAAVLWIQKVKTFCHGLLYLLALVHLASVRDLRWGWWPDSEIGLLINWLSLSVAIVTLISTKAFAQTYWPKVKGLPTIKSMGTIPTP